MELTVPRVSLDEPQRQHSGSAGLFRGIFVFLTDASGGSSHRLTSDSSGGKAELLARPPILSDERFAGVVSAQSGVARALADIANAFGLNASQIAEVLGVTRKTIYDWGLGPLLVAKNAIGFLGSSAWCSIGSALVSSHPRAPCMKRSWAVKAFMNCFVPIRSIPMPFISPEAACNCRPTLCADTNIRIRFAEGDTVDRIDWSKDCRAGVASGRRCSRGGPGPVAASAVARVGEFWQGKSRHDCVPIVRPYAPDVEC